MEKAQKSVLTLLGISLAVIAILAFIYVQKVNSGDENSDIPLNQTILYYGSTCPHCKIVEEFIAQNNITLKLNFTQKESFENSTNGNELLKVGKFCKLNQNEIGAVPLLFYENICYIGDQQIIDLLNKTFPNEASKK